MLPGQGKKTGFTLMELLTVLMIISLLAGVLIPSMNAVRKAAKNAKQKAQFAAIEVALLAFKNDDGDYPPSNANNISPPLTNQYLGAQKLAEAMVGWDLMGFHPDSIWDSAGTVYDSNNLDERHYYLDRNKANVFRLGDTEDKPGLFEAFDPMAPYTFVLCDSFGVRRLIIGGKRVLAGTPILYYRANPNAKFKFVDSDSAVGEYTYTHLDNYDLIGLGKLTSNGETSKSHGDFDDLEKFAKYINDETATNASGLTGDKYRTYNPETYILISAGGDGEYGTADDITNFGN